MKRHYMVTTFFCFFLLTGCPKPVPVVPVVPPPPVTITLPAGVTCTGALTVKTKAWIANPPGRFVLHIRICVFCNKVPLSNVKNISIAIIANPEILPITYKITDTFPKTGISGCTTKRYVLKNTNLKGAKVKVSVVDSTGGNVVTDTVTIE